MDNKEWSDIIVKCAEDYTKLKSMDKVETPPRDFIRAWMQINYSIFKLSGHFFRMFNSVLRKKYDEGTISESFVRKTSKTDKDSILDNGFVFGDETEDPSSNKNGECSEVETMWKDS